ncbi:MAG: pyruvate:ferredoxin (flavodoxin) oxidoreductase, partial [Oscillospiraceae bacterium]|nr:pyruvate:ferredoxin (flavodoxin) oxidoreductase [Oscillospiraceae bacterium]
MKRKTMDGNTAAAHVAYAFTDVAGIYPITPSSVMAELADKWSAGGQKNLFGQTVRVAEMQSEAGAAGTVHGSLSAGALTTTFTASQGLLLMIPNMYKIAGELLPGVIHCSARALASHALSIFGDHSDVMACRQTGFAMLASTSPQEVMHLGAVAHLAAIKGRVPFLHFFDGFRTSHEMQKIDAWDYSELGDMLDNGAVAAFRARALNPEHPVQRGTAQNPDIFFQAREACNPYYDALPDVVTEYMDAVNAKCGTDYKLFNYYGAPDAERVIVAMGSVCDTIEETIDYMNANGEKVGLVKVRLYRPFVGDAFAAALPKTVRKIAVLDRTKEPGALGEPLYLDVFTALAERNIQGVQIVGGRYGLGSKDTPPSNIFAVYENLSAAAPKNKFTIGINDDVTNLSLPLAPAPDTTPKATVSCKFWGLGSDGTVGANKNSIKIIGDHTDKYAQAYFAYDSKKSGGVTISHLRFGDEPIKSTYFVSKADFVACHNPSYVDKYKMVEDVKPGGVFLLSCDWDLDGLNSHLPGSMKRYIAQNGVKFYTVDGIGLARGINRRGLGVNVILQAAFFKLANIIPLDDAVKYMKDAIVASYGKKGQDVVDMNFKCVDAGIGNVREVAVPADWSGAPDSEADLGITGDRPELVDFVKDILIPVNRQQGDALPVSAFKDADGTFPQGSAAYEKRGIAVDVPEWVPENCIQCNQCSYVCPHAVIRPFALDAGEAANAPQNVKKTKMTGKGLDALQYTITPSVLDCTGCGSCANVCPAKEKALVMKPIESQLDGQAAFDYLAKHVTDKPAVYDAFKPDTVKGSQFKQPLLEFSGACAGCGETPYATLVTQLYGDRMLIANATGCSSIWGGSAPSTPYTVNKKGHGPAWANSLFEDNAEYGFGMVLGVAQRREKLAEEIRKMIAVDYCVDELKKAGQAWLDAMNDGEASKAASAALIAACEDGLDVDLTGTQWEAEWLANGKKCVCEACTGARYVMENQDMLVKKSVWVFGGDGWAYDIGFGGLDHVIASGEDVNILVFDTEVYSNTGGQASKASQIGQVAQFAASGKTQQKKDLAQIAMSYGYVYVAQVAMGANYAQTIKAIAEAESYPGPSLVIAYAPCINHGVKGGMGNSIGETKNAVESGYWHNFRFDPRLTAAGKNPFQLDSKAPSKSYKDFIGSEGRYNSLKIAFPDRAETLFDKAEQAAEAKYKKLERFAK